MRNLPVTSPAMIKYSFIILALIKLWLVSDLPLFAIGDAVHDDRLFINLADALSSGDWLGPYNNLTLAKGPFYPLWIAVTYLFGIPLLLAQHLLYIVACVIFIIAIRPIFTKQSVLLLIWTLMLFNPMSYANVVMTRVTRESIYPSLAILVVAGAVGLLARHDRPLKKLLPWSAFLGFSLSAFWLTREEGVWMIPSILTIVGFTVVRMRQAQPHHWRLISSVCILPFCIWLIAIVAVAGINKTHYGLFTTVEFKSRDFLVAYGALTRVKHAHWHPSYPVPRETRERIYRISPSFVNLAPFLEGYIGAAWTFNCCKEAFLCEDIGGGCFVWALRDAVAVTGHYISAESSADYYRRLADEINTACSSGQIECGAERASMMPPWHSENISPLVNTFIRGALYLSRFDGFQAQPLPSTGSEESLMLFQRLTGSKLCRGEDMDNIKISILSQIGKVYQITVPYLVVLAIIGYIRSTVKIFRTRIFMNFWAINTALLIALVIRLLILSLIDMTSFPSIKPQYLAPAYPLILTFAILALVGKFEESNISSQDDREFNEDFPAESN